MCGMMSFLIWGSSWGVSTAQRRFRRLPLALLSVLVGCASICLAAGGGGWGGGVANIAMLPRRMRLVSYPPPPPPLGAHMVTQLGSSAAESA